MNGASNAEFTEHERERIRRQAALDMRERRKLERWDRRFISKAIAGKPPEVEDSLRLEFERIRCEVAIESQTQILAAWYRRLEFVKRQLASRSKKGKLWLHGGAEHDALKKSPTRIETPDGRKNSKLVYAHVTCKVCGKFMHLDPYKGGRRQFCSPKCRQKAYRDRRALLRSTQYKSK